MKNNIAKTLLEYSRQFYDRGWMWGTAGNLSIRQRASPLQFTITPSGVNKGMLEEEDLLSIIAGKPFPKHTRGYIPSAETAIHQAIYDAIPGAGAVFHVHPMHATLLSGLHGNAKELQTLRMEWIEMQKGIGIHEGETPEIPIFPNWQDIPRLAQDVSRYLKSTPKAPPLFLIYNHGMTAWGTTPDQARNHLECMEWISQFTRLKKSAAIL